MVKSIKVMDAQVMKVIMMLWYFLFGVNVCLFVLPNRNIKEISRIRNVSDTS